MTTDFAHIPLAHITASLHNPRKTFDHAKLAELAESIRATGVHQPILVRPLPGTRVADTDRAVRYEIVAGERRYRASQQAGLDTIPAMIRQLADAEALEIQLIENLQREDIPALDEAEGYDHLLQSTGQSAEELAQRIGKSRSYVYARLKLLALGHEGRQALREGALDFSRALLLARIPDTKLQAKATAEIITGHHSARDASAHIQQHYMLRLEHAHFPIASADLLPAAGPCPTCPKRTGADRDLFADITGTDLCTDPACYQAKQQAHKQRAHEAVLAKGATIIDGDEARLLIPRPDPKAIPGHRRLDDSRDSPPGQPPLRMLLGDAAIASVGPPTYIADPHAPGALIAVITNPVANALLREAGKLPPEKTGRGPGPSTATTRAADAMATAAAEAMATHEPRWRTTAARETWAAIQRERERTHNYLLPDIALRHLALQQIDRLSDDDLRFAADAAGLGPVAPATALATWVEEQDDIDMALALLLLAQCTSVGLMAADNTATEALLTRLAKEHGVNAEEIHDQSLAQAKAEAQPAAEPTASTPTAPAAPADGGAGKGKGKGKKAKPERPAAPPAVREDEARQGIAAAMQSIDDGAPVADAQAPTQPAGAGEEPCDAPAAHSTQGGIGIGTNVRVNATVSPKAKAIKWAGHKGNIVAKVGPEAWLVHLWNTKASDHTVRQEVFHATELDVLPLPAQEATT